jgi:nucleotide-binding universal stress UspA family protein
MSYAALMLHLDPDGDNAARLALAAALAERCGAAVIGVAASDPQPAPYFYAAYGDQVLGEDRIRVERRLIELGETFRQAMAGKAKAAEWRAAIAPPAPFVSREARAADLVIVGEGPGGPLSDPSRDLDAADIVMRAGRPVLVVPAKAAPLTLDCAVVAWKDTREARRAVQDALPMLRLYRRTVVAAIEEDKEESGDPHRRLGVEDVASFLARHGVNAETRVMLSFGDAVGQLDAIAAERGADLIVAGAYGHSRFSEWAFGGVTNDLLTKPPRCLLLSH